MKLGGPTKPGKARPPRHAERKPLDWRRSAGTGTLPSARYHLGIKNNTKSSVTLPYEELQLVNRLEKRLGAKSNVEVIRRGLYLLRDTTERESLRQAYAQAARRVRATTESELAELDHLSAEGLDPDA